MVLKCQASVATPLEKVYKKDKSCPAHLFHPFSFTLMHRYTHRAHEPLFCWILLESLQQLPVAIGIDLTDLVSTYFQNKILKGITYSYNQNAYLHTRQQQLYICFKNLLSRSVDIYLIFYDFVKYVIIAMYCKSKVHFSVMDFKLQGVSKLLFYFLKFRFLVLTSDILFSRHSQF